MESKRWTWFLEDGWKLETDDEEDIQNEEKDEVDLFETNTTLGLSRQHSNEIIRYWPMWRQPQHKSPETRCLHNTSFDDGCVRLLLSQAVKGTRVRWRRKRYTQNRQTNEQKSRRRRITSLSFCVCLLRQAVLLLLYLTVTTCEIWRCERRKSRMNTVTNQMQTESWFWQRIHQRNRNTVRAPAHQMRGKTSLLNPLHEQNRDPSCNGITLSWKPWEEDW